MSNTGFKPSQELSLKYDHLINGLYDAKNIYDTKIITNEKLIEDNMNTYYKQELHNQSLKIMLLAFFIICIVVLLYRLNLFNSLYILTIIIVAIILLAMLFIYYSYYMYDYNSYLNRISKETAKSLSNNNVPIGNELNCDYLQEEESNINIGKIDSSSGKTLQSNYNKSLKNIDSNYDIWLKGDHNSTQKINENNYKNVDLDISDYRNSKNGLTDIVGKIKPINPNDATYYECEYIGANHNGMPLEKKYMNSTIPCNYYIDYKENGKYIKDNSGKLRKI